MREGASLAPLGLEEGARGGSMGGKAGRGLHSLQGHPAGSVAVPAV